MTASGAPASGARTCELFVCPRLRQAQVLRTVENSGIFQGVAYTAHGRLLQLRGYGTHDASTNARSLRLQAVRALSQEVAPSRFHVEDSEPPREPEHRSEAELCSASQTPMRHVDCDKLVCCKRMPPAPFSLRVRRCSRHSDPMSLAAVGPQILSRI